MTAPHSTPFASFQPIASLKAKNGWIGAGTYRLTGAEEKISRTGAPYLRLVLEDASGTMTGSVWPEYRHLVDPPAIVAAVSVSGRVKVFDERPHLNVERLAAASMDEPPFATDLLPRHRCPESALAGLDAVAALERSLPTPLNGFLKRVLLDQAHALPFLHCRASVSHHHAFAGGLLAHSTQMLDVAAELARRVLPNDATAPAMVQLGLLLHDLGKLRTVGATRRPPGALVIPHEFISIEILAPHLRWLELQDFKLALGLRFVLSYLATPKKARPIAKYAVAEIIERLDELSAATHHGRGLAHLTGRRGWQDRPHRRVLAALR